MAGEGRQGKVVLIMGKGEELKKYAQKNKRGRKRKGEVMDQWKKVGDKKVKMSSGSTSGTAEVEKLEEKKVRKTRGSTATAVKESPRKWPVRERKVVERFSFPPVRELASMFLFIKKGKGMKLKDIPNGMVCLDLSKRGDKRTRTVNMIQASSPEELAEVEGSLEERITTEDDVSEYEEHKAESKEQENFLPEEYGIEVKKELEEKEQDAASKKEKVTLIKKKPASKTVTEKQQTGEKEAHAEAHAGPSHEEMWDMVTGLLKEVKFDVLGGTTDDDPIILLVEHFVGMYEKRRKKLQA
ncbi:hypothetical protein MRB53_007780 [Persea americana]|uniref:Uncharacterized protein n=1 Tax=Persea americana TaxID=3435 RepID=A0ACC2MJV4_PERAE|nr:hypothetical protein MRB53_007780 [Persea americana]